ncbi:MAG: cation acetate symporter [Planctomycetes bacterium GWF2_42_9]|nr:MAG: cation acetate symporter [Planctomycetes bacterium GWF2_42_9]
MYETSSWAIAIFVAFVSFVLWISYHFARKTKTAKGYFAAGGNIHWSVNGIAFAGDYLSAASFLGICGMIATVGYDGFLYSIGYLAGWIVALFVVAEPMKRLGKFTFTDAIDAKFNSKGVQLTAAISTLVVSTFYLIPQMVGAGTLVTPLLGLPHWMGVVMVGTIVIIIVATAGMASTTYVQFLKGGLLIIFSITIVIVTLYNGLTTHPKSSRDTVYHQLATLPVKLNAEGQPQPQDWHYKLLSTASPAKGFVFAKLDKDNTQSWWHLTKDQNGEDVLTETYWVTVLANPVTDKKGLKVSTLYNGIPITESKPIQEGHIEKLKYNGKEVDSVSNLSIAEFLQSIKESTIVRFLKKTFPDGDDKVTVYYQTPTSGKDILTPGILFKVDSAKGATLMNKLNFVSLMMALFFGTAALPHILIRYYTVPTPAAARKSTIVAIAAIGLFYVLTLFMGLGAMVNGVVDLTDNNMSAPLLAKSFGITLFAIISAIAFATVLGTVSGLIVAASGAVAHDLMDRFFDMKLTDKKKVQAGKIAAVSVGCIAMLLGVAFKGMNVSYLVGWAFAVAASANLPAIIMLLFWKGTTKQGVASSIIVGILSSVGLILLSPDMFERYGMLRTAAPISLDNPGIVSIPLSFIVLVVVSLLSSSQKNKQYLRPSAVPEKLAV